MELEITFTRNEKWSSARSNSCKHIHSGTRLAIQVPVDLPTRTCKCGNSQKTWIPWRPWWLSRLPSRKTQFSRRTSYAQQLLGRVYSDVMGPFIEGYRGEKYCLPFIDEMSRKAFIKTLKSRSEVAVATLELIKKEQRRTQAPFVYLRNGGAKDYKTKVLQDFLRQEGISHEVTERHCPQSNGLAERLNLTIMDKVHCMLINANLTLKLCPYAANYAAISCNNFPDCSSSTVKVSTKAGGKISKETLSWKFSCWLQSSRYAKQIFLCSIKRFYLQKKIKIFCCYEDSFDR